ncbi:MAG: nucleoside-triphosphatase [Elusimicrobiaceae bacterium]|nr:nucleoside-triphosphatase [Elusimicrobiaceae bacterium]
MVFFITGPKNSGKTAFVKNLHSALEKAGLETGGIVSEGEPAGEKKSLYFVKSLRTGKRMKLLEIGGGPVPDKAGFDFADAVLGKAQNYKTVIIDEFGPLEAAGVGYGERVMRLSRGHDLIITVRPALAVTAAELFSHAGTETLSVENKTPAELEELARHIIRCLSK